MIVLCGVAKGFGLHTQDGAGTAVREGACVSGVPGNNRAAEGRILAGGRDVARAAFGAPSRNTAITFLGEATARSAAIVSIADDAGASARMATREADVFAFAPGRAA